MPKGVFVRPPRYSRVAHHRDGKERLPPLPKALEEACRNFETEVGGRDSLVAQLVHARLTPEQDLLVGAIADPTNDAFSLARICALHGIRFGDLLIVFRDAGLVRAQLAAMRKVWERLPQVAGDVMDRAIPHLLECPACRGTKVRVKFRAVKKSKEAPDGVKEVQVPCLRCAGTGEILVQPDLDRQKVALEVGGMLRQEGGGVQVNVQAQAQAGVFGNFAAASDAVLYPQPAAPPVSSAVEDGEEPVDAEVVEAASGEEPVPPLRLPPSGPRPG